MFPRHVDLLFVLVLATMVAEMAFQLSGDYSALLLLLYCLVSFIVASGFTFQRRAWFFLVPAALYVITGLLTGPSLSVVQGDIFSIVQGVAFVLFAGTATFDAARRDMLLLNLHRSFAIVGFFAAYIGLVKLVLLNRGSILTQFTTPTGIPFVGTSLNGDYNVYSMALVVSLCSAVWLLRREPKVLFRYLCHATVPGIAAALLLTSSRRGIAYLLVSAVALTAWIIATRKSSATRAGTLNRGALGLVYSSVVVLMVLNEGQLREGIADFFAESEVRAITLRYQSIQSGQATQTREWYFSQGAAEIAAADVASLLIGQGFGYVTQMGAVTGELEDYPHNFVLSAMLYGGVLQTTVTLLMLGAALRASWRQGRDGQLLGYMLLCMIVFLLVSSNSIFSMELLVAVLLLVLERDSTPLTASLFPIRQSERSAAPPRLSPQGNTR